MRKFITEIINPLEESLIDEIIQSMREKLTRKPNWTRGEVNDLLTEVIQGVQNARRKSPDSKIREINP